MRTLTSSLTLLLLLALTASAADFQRRPERLSEKRLRNCRQRVASARGKGRRAFPIQPWPALHRRTWSASRLRQAVTWFERSAQQDYDKAQLNLGALYASGKGVRRDYVQAYKWLNVCAAKGDQKCVAQRDLVADKLKPKQLATAQRLASQFTPRQEPGKEDPNNPDK